MRNFLIRALLLLPGIIWLYAFPPAFLGDIDNRLHDYRLNFRGSQPADSRIVIIGIDQNSIDRLNRPYFAFAEIFAQLTDLAVANHAAALLIDLILPPSSEKAIKDHVASVSHDLGLELPQAFFRRLGFDQAFRSALLRLKNSTTRLVIGYAHEQNQSFLGDAAILRIAQRESTGFFNLPSDRDGRIRRALLRAPGSEGHSHSVGALTAAALGSGSATIDLDAYHLINYRGRAGSFSTISLAEIFSAVEKKPELLQNKLVLLGFTDITDSKATPFGYMPGVEVQANIIDNIINDRFLRKPGKAAELVLTTLLLLAAMALGCRNHLYAIASLVMSSMLLLIVPFYTASEIALPTARPALLFLLPALVELGIYIRRIFLDRRRIRTVFSRYVSDAVLKEVLAATDQDFISGKRRRLCIFMADIRGFTSFSEKREATEVVAFLNRYFARTTAIIMKHGGVVDKFLGDGLLAFFNAPVEHDDFVDRAVRAALEIGRFCRSEEFAGICGQSGLQVGMALHIGSVVFGNIGSEKKAEFTVIGDAVNACSRMESLNKEFATSLIVSEEVVKECHEEVEWRLLSRQALRGKSEAISLFTTV